MKKYIRFAAFTAGTTLAGSWIASTQGAPSATGHSSARRQSVVADDNRARVSLAEPSDTDRWTEIFALNQDAVVRPGVIAASLAFNIRTVAAVPVDDGTPPSDQAPSEKPPAITHTVAAGEGLSGIAQSKLGASDRWVEIYALNRGVLAAPDLLYVGLVLDIPTSPVAVPADLLASLATARSSLGAGQGTTSTQAAPSSGVDSGTLAAIRACESSGNYGAVSASGQYRGAYQFDLQTWQSVGGTGDPAAASPAEQDARASQLLTQRGSNPWPNCG